MKKKENKYNFKYTNNAGVYWGGDFILKKVIMAPSLIKAKRELKKSIGPEAKKEHIISVSKNGKKLRTTNW